MPRPARRASSRPVPPASPVLGPRAWQGVTYRPCQPGASEVRDLYRFAGAWCPPAADGEVAWEAVVDGRVLGGVLVERADGAGFVHGPVVVEPPTGAEPLAIAAQLIAAVLDQAGAAALDTLFARPLGLDRVWVRLGFVPIPEAALPAVLRNRPGTGLHCWRRPGSYTIALPDPTGSRRGGRRDR